ncbi:MAG: ribonuclease-3 [Bacteroidia bacterium]|jgi:ribonuclease-3
MTDIARLQAALGYEFNDPALLLLALTHRSAGGHNNERLEFLGDSILNHIIAEALYQQFPESREGEMSRMRASLVKGDTLAEVAIDLGLAEHLIMGAGERKSGGHRRASIRGDAVEAVIGAMLLDSDVERCRERVLSWYRSRLDELRAGALDKDAKTRLQEFLQGRGLPLPEYELQGEYGEDHKKEFRVACRIAEPAIVHTGTGTSRRKAEQDAAAAVLQAISGGTTSGGKITNG